MKCVNKKAVQEMLVQMQVTAPKVAAVSLAGRPVLKN